MHMHEYGMESKKRRQGAYVIACQQRYLRAVKEKGSDGERFKTTVYPITIRDRYSASIQ